MRDTRATPVRRGLAVLLVAIVTAAWPAPAGAIINGQADNGAHPNVGTLIWRDADGFLFRACSGTLISPSVFLTAAHCVLPPPGFPDEHVVGVSFDEHITTPPTTYLPGTPHADPGFVWGNGQGAGATGPHNNDPHDIAVVVLDQEVSTTPARLPTLNLLDELHRRNGLRGTTFVTVGYGATDPEQPGYAHCCGTRGDRRFATETFASLTNAILHTDQNEARGNGGGCYGDSGGPHFIGTTDVIAAITYTGDMPCVASATSYRVDTPVARAFLDDFVAVP